jgi:hypothetical protein
MAKPNQTRRYNLQREISRVRAEFPPIEIELPYVPSDGEGSPEFHDDVLEVPATQNLPDDVVEMASTRPVEAARRIAGPKWAHFVAAGGSGNVFWNIVQTHNEASVGESSSSDDS